MTWTAKLKVQDVSSGPGPIDVLAVAEVADGTLITNTEKMRSVEVKFVIDADETSINEGDTIPASGHFDATLIDKG